MPAAIDSIQQTKSGRLAEYSLALCKGDLQIQVRVVRRRRKTLAIYVERDDVIEVRAPANCAWDDINKFLIDRFEWIVRAREELANTPEGLTNCYETQGHVYFVGERLPLELIRSRFTVVERGPQTLYVACSNPGNPDLIERHLMNWYRQRAELLFAERIAVINPLFEDAGHPKGLTLRKMKSRWGSCSSRGEICLNLLLIKEALPQIDFVIAHELCHLRHFAHNKAFYQLLDKVMPDWRQRESGLGRAC